MKRLVVCFTAIIMILTINVIALAEEIPIEADEGVIYVPTQSQSDESEEGSVANELGKIINGEDHTTDLFGLDKFDPTGVDTSWVTPVINGVAWLTSSLCGIYFAFTLLKLLVDCICLILPAFGKMLFSARLGWLYSDTCAVLAGLPLPEGQTAPKIDPMPESKSGKIAYWLKDSLITAIICGALLACIAIGLLPQILSFLINAAVNLLQYAYNWVTAL